MISLGPFSVPAEPLMLAAAFIISSAVGKRAAFAQRKEIEYALYSVMLVGIFVARLAFVIQYWDLYRRRPLGMLDIRDGGFAPWVGVFAAVGMALYYLIRARINQRAMLLSLSAGVLTLSIGAGTAWVWQRNNASVRLPTQTLMGLDNKPLQLDTLRGKPVIINLWASWCPPCRHEMPVLQQAQFSNPDIVFVFANQGETAADATHYLMAQQLVMSNVVLDAHRDIARLLGANALPTTLFFDRAGILVDERTGELSAASLASRLALVRANITR